jgi:hypothetical protein
MEVSHLHALDLRKGVLDAGMTLEAVRVLTDADLAARIGRVGRDRF